MSLSEGEVPAFFDVDLGLLEDFLGKLLDQLLDVDGLDVQHFVLVLQLDHVLALPPIFILLNPFGDFPTNHAGHCVLGRLGIGSSSEFILKAFLYVGVLVGGQVLADVGGGLEGVAVVANFCGFVSINRDQVILQFVLDELLVVEDLPQVLFGVIIELFEEGGTMVRNSLKPMPSVLLSPLV